MPVGSGLQLINTVNNLSGGDVDLVGQIQNDFYALETRVKAIEETNIAILANNVLPQDIEETNISARVTTLERRAGGAVHSHR